MRFQKGNPVIVLLPVEAVMAYSLLVQVRVYLTIAARTDYIFLKILYLLYG